MDDRSFNPAFTRSGEMPAPWQRSRRVTIPGSDDVHIWLCNLNQQLAGADDLWETLSPDERQRAGSFRFKLLSQRYIAAHGFLRLILTKYLQTEPANIIIETDALGKPFITPRSNQPDVHFNLSHSGAFSLAAFRLGVPLGIDIEWMRPLEDLGRIAGHYFAAQEVQALAALPFAEQLAGFYACWTRKEAFIKATGLGLSQSLDRFAVSLKPDEPVRILSIDNDPEPASRWSLLDIPVPDGYRAALASPRPISTVSYFFYP